MVPAWLVLADANLPARRPGWDPRLLWATVALVVVILLGALVLVWLDRWRKQPGPAPLSANDQLAQFRELYERGELSPEEFERIRASLEPQLRQEMDVPRGPPHEGPAVPPPIAGGREPPS